MDLDDYEDKLKSALGRVIKEHVEHLGSLKIRTYQVDIEELIGAGITLLLDSVKPHQLLSGNEFKFDVEGVIDLFEKVEGGSTRRRIEFQIRPAIAKFDLESESFIITDIAKFAPVNYSRY